MFDRCFALVLEEEGGLSEEVWDDGGTTRYGISLRFLREAGIDTTGDGIVTDADVRALTPERARLIYLEHFWRRPGIGELPWWAAIATFDGAVNHGPGRAIRFLQSALIEASGGAASLGIDGVIGPRTVSLAAAVTPRRALAGYFRRRVELYIGHPDWPHAGRGWIARVSRIWAAALAPPGGSA